MGEHIIKNKNKISANKIVILICIVIYIVYFIMNSITNDNISTMILFGADYKTFTLGLGEYYRLITSGFCHFSLLHLAANMISLYSLGTIIETIYGTKKYLLYLFGGILLGSLTSGVLNTNILESGISSALYTFFTMFLLFVLIFKQPLINSLFPIIFLNIGLNFMPNVAWQAHLGGAIAGVIFFYIDYYDRNKLNNYKYLLSFLLIFTIIFLSFKYYKTKDSINDFKDTDFNYVYYTYQYVPVLNKHYENKIYNYYKEKGK